MRYAPTIVMCLFSLSIAAGCAQRPAGSREDTRERIVRQYEFEDRYLDMAD